MSNIDYFELEDLEVYKLVKEGNIFSFPSGFWDGVDGLLRAKTITRYLFEEILKLSINEIRDNSTTQMFKDNSLGGMLSVLFNGSRFLAIANAYDELKEWGENKYIQCEETENRKYSEEELILLLQRKAIELNRVPKGIDLQSPHKCTYHHRFGSWEKALIAAGLHEDIYKDVDKSESAKQTLLFDLKNLALKLDRLPNKEEVFKIINEGELKTHFKGWGNLLKVLSTNYSKEELIQIIQQKYKRLGRTPNNTEMKIPQAIVFIDKFGSWNNAIKEAGL